jgi:hypothetical protein
MQVQAKTTDPTEHESSRFAGCERENGMHFPRDSSSPSPPRNTEKRGQPTYQTACTQLVEKIVAGSLSPRLPASAQRCERES